MISDMSTRAGSHSTRVALVPLPSAEAPEPRRSLGGWIAPLLCALVAVGCLTWLLIFPGQDWGIPLDPDWILLLTTGCATFVAVWVERQVQNQLHLAHRGDEAHAHIDHVVRPNQCRDEIVVTYHFIASDGVRYDGRSTVSSGELNRFTRSNTKVVALYDPQRPQNNALIGSMWGVSWNSKTN